MSLVKSGQIANCCGPNALMTLKEYLEDYAQSETKAVGEKLIAAEVKTLENSKIKHTVDENLIKIHNGERDFKF